MKEFCDSLDYDNNYYFYHETSDNKAKSICEQGLLLSGYNIVKARNLLLTTALPLPKEIACDEAAFSDFLEDEISPSDIRPITEMVIIAVPKEDIDYVVIKNENNYYHSDVDSPNYMVQPQYILGYFDLETKNFTPNPESYYSGEFSYKL